MPSKDNRESKDEKSTDQPVRDLPPKKDVKGGKADEKKGGAGRAGEIDFMQNY